MKKINSTIKIVLLIAATFLLAQCSVRKSEPIQGEFFQPTNERVVNGEKVFMVHCQKCHPGGEAGLGPSINGNPAPQFIKRFQMRHGLGVMPGFNQKEISKSDLRDISKYLKAWKKH